MVVVGLGADARLAGVVAVVRVASVAVREMAVSCGLLDQLGLDDLFFWLPDG